MNLFDVNFESLNLLSFMGGMTFAAFLNYWRRTAFMYIIAYLVAASLYYGMIKPMHPEVTGNSVSGRTIGSITSKSSCTNFGK